MRQLAKRQSAQANEKAMLVKKENEKEKLSTSKTKAVHTAKVYSPRDMQRPNNTNDPTKFEGQVTEMYEATTTFVISIL